MRAITQKKDVIVKLQSGPVVSDQGNTDYCTMHALAKAVVGGLDKGIWTRGVEYDAKQEEVIKALSKAGKKWEYHQRDFLYVFTGFYYNMELLKFDGEFANDYSNTEIEINVVENGGRKKIPIKMKLKMQTCEPPH